jgi:hypothetical protein
LWLQFPNLRGDGHGHDGVRVQRGQCVRATKRSRAMARPGYIARQLRTPAEYAGHFLGYIYAQSQLGAPHVCSPLVLAPAGAAAMVPRSPFGCGCGVQGAAPPGTKKERRHSGVGVRWRSAAPASAPAPASADCVLRSRACILLVFVRPQLAL